MYDICDAIRHHRLISLSYHGHHRVVEPHTYGVGTGGHSALSAYQVRGSSESGEPLDWRFFHESDMRIVTVTQKTFEVQLTEEMPNRKYLFQPEQHPELLERQGCQQPDPRVLPQRATHQPQVP